METEVIAADDPGVMERALAILGAGGLVAFPTDTVYGVGCLAFSDAAVRSIYVAKDRPIEKAIPVLVAESVSLELVADNIPAMAWQLAEHFWPGAMTLVVMKNSRLPEAVSASATVGVRVPDHAVTRRLLSAAGPMAVTSANASGKANPSSAHEVKAQLGGRIPLIMDGGRTPGGVPSTVVDCTGDEPRVLRPGPISLEEILRVLK